MILLLASAFAGDTWTEVRPGISWLHHVESTQDWHAVIVDLSRDEIWVRATREGERKQSVPSFASSVGATVAINGDFFSYSDYFPVGQAVGGGQAWTGKSDLDNWSFVACSVDKECWIDPPGHLASLGPRVWNSVGGNQDLVVMDGAVQTRGDSVYSADRHPRTAVGLSQDGRTMILLVVDGRRSGAAGMTFNEVGAVMGSLGAWDAIMLDGGGSTTMWIDGATRNDPSDGSARTVSNHLAILVSGSPDVACTIIPNGRYCLDSTRMATCEGGRYTEGDCAAYGATCEEQDDFAYCVDARCAGDGQGGHCASDTALASCTDGVYAESDCGGATCVESWDGEAWCATEFYQGELETSSFANPARGPAGSEVEGVVELLNTGLSPWTPGVTKLAPVPRDQASPLAASSWENDHRAATVSAVTNPGEIGVFALSLRVPESRLEQDFALVQEGVTWFADAPLGGGPEDGFITLVTEPGRRDEGRGSATPPSNCEGCGSPGAGLLPALSALLAFAAARGSLRPGSARR